MQAKAPTIFDRMEFDPYEFREYPKHVYPPGLTYPAEHPEIHMRGQPMPVEVHSAGEERDVMSAERPLDSEAAGREGLRRQLAQLGVQVDRSWDMGRLYEELALRASRLASQHKFERGQSALGGNPGEIEWGTEPEDTESERRASESFNREPQLHAEDPKPGGDQDMVDLRMQAASIGLRVDGLWSADRLRQEIAKMTDPDYSPGADQDMIDLRVKARSIGLKVDGRWSADRLRQEIAKATDQNYEPGDGGQ